MRSRYETGASMAAFLLALGTSGVAVAQDAAAPKAADGQAVDGQAVAQNDQASIGDIVVTAQRRSESVQRSSLSIEVLSPEALSDVKSPADLSSVTPGVQIGGTSGVVPQVFVRGIGDTNGNSRAQSAVAFNIDGVYYGRTNQVTPQLFDLQRVEILKGPQGTLYGRNASGGAINVITNGARLGDLSASIGLEAGNFSLVKADAAINFPLGETLAVRVAGQIIHRNGYTSNGGADQIVQAGRLSLLWEPSTRVSLILRGDYSHGGGQGSGTVLKPAIGDKWRDITDLPGPVTFTTAFPVTDRSLNMNNWGASAELNADLGFATLTVIPAYRHQNIRSVLYPSNFRVSDASLNKQTSTEVRLGNDGSRLKWVLGGYYFREKLDVLLAIAPQGVSEGVNFNQGTEAFAGFGEATFSLTDKLRVIGGVRHTKEKLFGRYQPGFSPPPVGTFIPGGPVAPIDGIEFSRTNFKLGSEFDIGPQNMLFATYATGFKAGGFTQTATCGPDRYDPEEVNALTVGSRNRLADNALQVNAEAFYWKYKSQQLGYIGFDQCGAVNFLTRNLGDATLKGGNIDIIYKPTRHITLGASVEYNHATYDNFRLTSLGPGVYAPGGGSLCSATPVGGPTFSIDCNGQQLPRAPRWSGTFKYDHRFDLGGSNEIAFGADMIFASVRYLDIGYLPSQRAAPYQLFNASLTYNKKDQGLSVTAYVDNITNEAIYTQAFGSIPLLQENGTPYTTASIQPPRTYGVRLRGNF